jgi:hypothetical protein
VTGTTPGAGIPHGSPDSGADAHRIGTGRSAICAATLDSFPGAYRTIHGAASAISTYNAATTVAARAGRRSLGAADARLGLASKAGSISIGGLQMPAAACRR